MWTRPGCKKLTECLYTASAWLTRRRRRCSWVTALFLASASAATRCNLWLNSRARSAPALSLCCVTTLDAGSASPGRLPTWSQAWSASAQAACKALAALARRAQGQTTFLGQLQLLRESTCNASQLRLSYRTVPRPRPCHRETSSKQLLRSRWAALSTLPASPSRRAACASSLTHCSAQLRTLRRRRKRLRRSWPPRSGGAVVHQPGRRAQREY